MRAVIAARPRAARAHVARARETTRRYCQNFAARTAAANTPRVSNHRDGLARRGPQSHLEQLTCYPVAHNLVRVHEAMVTRPAGPRYHLTITRGSADERMPLAGGIATLGQSVVAVDSGVATQLRVPCIASHLSPNG